MRTRRWLAGLVAALWLGLASAAPEGGGLRGLKQAFELGLQSILEEYELAVLGLHTDSLARLEGLRSRAAEAGDLAAADVIGRAIDRVGSRAVPGAAAPETDTAEYRDARAQMETGVSTLRGRAAQRVLALRQRYYDELGALGKEALSQTDFAAAEQERYALFLQLQKGVAGVELPSVRSVLDRAAARTEPDRGRSVRDSYVAVKVFYATDRNATGSSAPEDVYGGQRGELTFGSCDVSIPRSHEVGELERPSWWLFEFKEDPAQHVVLMRVVPMDSDTFRRSTAAEARAGGGVLVYIHGFYNTFASAVRRTAQLTYDLGFPGPAVCYAWPSDRSMTRSGYMRAEANAAWTAVHLREVLGSLAEAAGDGRVHILAHSLGGRALAEAAGGAGDRWACKLNQIVLAAPDIDAEVFRREVAPRLGGVASRVTLYASCDDKALKFSQTIHGAARAGESGPHMVVVQGIDTVDATGIDTTLMGLAHAYFAQSDRVMRDITLLLRNQVGPSRRLLQENRMDDVVYWTFGQ